MFAGMTMRAFARPNLSPKARVYIDVLLKVMATVSDNIIYLLVGFAEDLPQAQVQDVCRRVVRQCLAAALVVNLQQEATNSTTVLMKKQL